MDLSDRVESVENLGFIVPFLEEIMIERKKKTIKQAKKQQMRMVFWTNRSKLNLSNIGEIVAQRDKNLDKQKETNIFLGKNKEIFDIKIWVIAMALKAAN